MRLTVNLESELYALAKSLAKAEDCSISTAVNRLLSRAVHRELHPARRVDQVVKRNGFVVSRGKRPVTADTVHRAEEEDDSR